MSRFKDLCPSSDSDSEEETQPFQRGRVRQNKRFTEIGQEERNKKVNDSKIAKQQQEKNQKQVKTQKKSQTVVPFSNKKQKLTNLSNNTDIYIQTNSYPSTSISLDANQKFIRQNIKPVQQQMQHYLQKMYNTLEQRKKFTNALAAAARDLEKVEKSIVEIHALEISKTFDESNTKTDQNQKTQQKKIETLKKLQNKINRHLSNLMTEHHKTVEILTLCRKQIENYFNKVKYTFLDTNSISLYEPQHQTYKEYGILQLYKIIEKADSVINQQTSFFTNRPRKN